jgi:hypothetical protein
MHAVTTSALADDPDNDPDNEVTCPARHCNAWDLEPNLQEP